MLIRRRHSFYTQMACLGLLIGCTLIGWAGTSNTIAVWDADKANALRESHRRTQQLRRVETDKAISDAYAEARLGQDDCGRQLVSLRTEAGSRRQDILAWGLNLNEMPYAGPEWVPLFEGDRLVGAAKHGQLVTIDERPELNRVDLCTYNTITD
ncbi:MAG: hypothetical protein AAF921_17925 [Cyanobacteria bacterium P01_D01_bin.44]